MIEYRVQIKRPLIYNQIVWFCGKFPKLSRKFLKNVMLQEYYVNGELVDNITVNDVFEELDKEIQNKFGK